MRKWISSMVWLAVNGFVLPAAAQICTPFTDVPASDPFCVNIQWMYNRGVTLGCSAPAGQQWYCSADFVRRDQMAAFMNRLANEAVFQQGGNAYGTTGELGTTDNEVLEIIANNSRIMRYEPGAVSPNLIGGSASNGVSAGVRGAVIGGGGITPGSDDPDFSGAAPNRVLDHYGTIAGGFANVVGLAGGAVRDGTFATISGGRENTAAAEQSTIAGGRGNVASGYASTVSGGHYNAATGISSTVAGGNGNVAQGALSAVLAGFNNHAIGDHSIAAGRDATADLEGCIMFAAWSVSATTRCGAPFTIRLFGDHGMSVEYGAPAPSGGGTKFFYVGDLAPGFMVVTSTGASLSDTGVWTSVSDEAAKEGFADVDKRDVLDRLAALPIRAWRYKRDPEGTRHIGPTAQDFGAAFGSSGDAKTIGMVDADGVALAAIQGLNAKLEAEVAALREELAQVRALLADRPGHRTGEPVRP